MGTMWRCGDEGSVLRKSYEVGEFWVGEKGEGTCVGVKVEDKVGMN